MARRRNYKRDSRGRFARTNGGAGKAVRRGAARGAVGAPASVLGYTLGAAAVKGVAITGSGVAGAALVTAPLLLPGAVVGGLTAGAVYAARRRRRK